MNPKHQTKHVPVLHIAALLLAAMAIETQPAQAANIPVTVNNVVLNSGSPVCRSNDPDGSIAVSASVSAGFTQDGTISSVGECSGPIKCSWDTGNKKNCSRRIDHEITTSVTPSLAVTAADNTSSNTASLSGTNPGTFSGSLPTGPEGKTSVKVTVSASEDVTTTDTAKTYIFGSIGAPPNTACTGPDPVPTTSSTTTTTSNKGSATASSDYLVDKLPPTVTSEHPGFFNNPPTIQQGENEEVQMQIKDGSAGTPWKLTLTATAPDASEITVTKDDSFGSSPDGVVATTHVGPNTLPTTCDSPTGEYSLAAVLKTQDLCGQPYDDIILAGAPFTVTPGVELSAQTVVLSQMTSGDYGIDQCFVNSVKQTKKLIVNNTPGSVHLGTIVTTSGKCAGQGTIEGVALKLTLPPLSEDGSGFVYDTTGNSPAAHVFVGDGSEGFDLHNGAPLTEVTVPLSTSGQEITADLSNLDLGEGPGVIPASDTIFVRAHARFNAFAKDDQPAPDTAFKFSSSASTASVDGSPLELTGSSDYYISANPTQSMNNLTGQIIQDGNQVCTEDGQFTPLITP